MKLLLTLAWRNIWRNRRRSVMTILAVVFATFFTMILRGLAGGTREYSLRSSVEMFSGYLQVQPSGYQENPSLARSLSYPGALRAMLLRTEGIRAFAPRIAADGLISFRDRSNGTMLLGMDAAAEEGVSRFMRRVVEGRFFRAGAIDEAVAGHVMLSNLGARIGDTVVVLAQGRDGVLGNLRFRIVGTVRMGVQTFDASTLLMDLGAAQELLAMEGRVSVVAITLDDFKRLTTVRDRLAGEITAAGIRDAGVLTWSEVMPDLEQAMTFDAIGDYFFMGLLVLVVGFGILNTVLMSVTERFREFGVTLAVGMRPSRLVLLVFLESAFLVAIGMAAGTAAGYGLNMYFKHHPIIFSGQFAELYAQYGYQPQMISSTDWWVIWQAASFVLVVAALAVVYPLIRVARLEPMKGIRHT